jgi:(S)-2-hydroxy-acid oxidase
MLCNRQGPLVPRSLNPRFRLLVLPRVLRDVSVVDTSTTMFGSPCPVPIGIAPSAMQKLVGGAGELDVARAATQKGINYTLSSQSTTSLEDVMSVKRDSSIPFWHQIYLTMDLDKSVPLIKRIEGW